MGDQFLKGLGALQVVPATQPWCVLSDATLSGFAGLVLWEITEKTQQLWSQSGVMTTAVNALREEVAEEVAKEPGDDEVIETKNKTIQENKTIQMNKTIQQRHDVKAEELTVRLQKDLKGLLAIRRREVVRPFKKYKSWPNAILRTFSNFGIIRISGDRSISKEQKQQRIDALDGIRKDGAAMEFREGFKETDFFKPFEGPVEEFDTQINEMMKSLWEYEIGASWEMDGFKMIKAQLDENGKVKLDKNDKAIEVPDPGISTEDIVNISKMIEDFPGIDEEQKGNLQKKCYTMLQMKTGDYQRRMNVERSRRSMDRGVYRDAIVKRARSAGRGLIAQVSKFNPLPKQMPAAKEAFDLLNGNKDPTDRLSQYKEDYKSGIKQLSPSLLKMQYFADIFAKPVTDTSEAFKNNN
tara:strand:- start:35 stop:1264 length:1230 start_codon:yes stop_codon:yes gene_type:complete